ncbi:MAG: hypothetical protein U5L08_07615 [Xanthomonadales bacterium]|nr:hypothetical protein [Xanthomonadales bacterium]
MTLRDDKGRENIVERFVHDLFAWLFHLIGQLLVSIITIVLLLFLIAGLTRCLSGEAEAATPATDTRQQPETPSCIFSPDC